MRAEKLKSCCYDAILDFSKVVVARVGEAHTELFYKQTNTELSRFIFLSFATTFSFTFMSRHKFRCEHNSTIAVRAVKPKSCCYEAIRDFSSSSLSRSYSFWGSTSHCTLFLVGR